MNNIIDEILKDGLKKSEKGFLDNNNLKRKMRCVKQKNRYPIIVFALIYIFLYLTTSILLIAINFESQILEIIKFSILFTSTINIIIMGYLISIGILKFNLLEGEKVYG